MKTIDLKVTIKVPEENQDASPYWLLAEAVRPGTDINLENVIKIEE